MTARIPRETIAPCLFCGSEPSTKKLRSELLADGFEKADRLFDKDEGYKKAIYKKAVEEEVGVLVEGRRTPTFRLSDIVPYLEVHTYHEVCFCEHHVDTVRQIVEEQGTMEPAKLLEAYERHLAKLRRKL
jgi:hypothetical protein